MCTKITRNILKGLQTFHNDYQRFEEKAFPCGKRAKRKRLIYELARNARSCVGAEGFSTFFRTLAISICVNGIRLLKNLEFDMELRLRCFYIVA